MLEDRGALPEEERDLMAVFKELGVGFRLESSAGSSQKRKAVVRKESADTHEYESRGCGRESGGVELHSPCGEQFGWMA